MTEEKRSSFERISYILRPRKQIERKIMIEVFQKIQPLIDIKGYKYIGMGSIFYYDYILFHKYLDMDNFLSIDNKSKVNRFIFNKPYDFIEFENMNSTDYLYEFSWDENVIIWLDYDSKIDDDESPLIPDIKAVMNNCSDKDILIFTINANCPPCSKRKKFLTEFKKYLSSEYQSLNTFTEKKFTQLIHDISINIIKEQELYLGKKFYQLFAFQYKDGATMFTLGGIIDKNDVLINKIKKMDIDFISFGEKIVEINIPILTYREKEFLDQNIKEHKTLIKKWQDAVISKDESEKVNKMTEMMHKEMPFELYSIKELIAYTTYYKYYPQYYEGII